MEVRQDKRQRLVPKRKEGQVDKDRQMVLDEG